jgi:hypothetical protein
MDGTVCIQNSTEGIQEAPCSVVKCAGLYIDSVGGHFEQQIAKVTKVLLNQWETFQETLNQSRQGIQNQEMRLES